MMDWPNGPTFFPDHAHSFTYSRTNSATCPRCFSSPKTKAAVVDFPKPLPPNRLITTVFTQSPLLFSVVSTLGRFRLLLEWNYSFFEPELSDRTPWEYVLPST